MSCTLGELANLVDGCVVGDPTLSIESAATLDTAGPADVTFITSLDRNSALSASQAGAVVAPVNSSPAQIPALRGRSLLLVDDVLAAFSQIVVRFRPRRSRQRLGISPLAVISPSAKLAEDVDVHPGAVIGDDVQVGRGTTIHSGVHVMAGCSIGNNCLLFPGVVLYEDSIVGARCVIHAGAVLGAYGFGYSLREGRHELSAQLGYVLIEDDVEIGAAATIDRGTFGPTRIGQGTKLDNQVMIAHNCRIGKHNLICSQVGVAGSTTTGDYVVMAGQVGVRDHVHIGDRAVLAAKAGVAHDVEADTQVFGQPARPMREQKQILAAISRLPQMRKQLKLLEQRVNQLSGTQGPTQDKSAA